LWFSECIAYAAIALTPVVGEQRTPSTAARIHGERVRLVLDLLGRDAARDDER
jgi:hypothetical protein